MSYPVPIAAFAGLALLVVSADLTMAKQATSQPKIEAQLEPHAAAAGATVVIAGTGFGAFQSAQANRVLFNGVPALVQRWEPTIIEVRVPSGAKDGPVELIKGKQSRRIGSFSVRLPVIQAITPVEAEPGALITIAGEHFGPTAGPRDPNSMFGVNDVLVGGVAVRASRWRDDKIEVEIPGNAQGGTVQIRLSSSDPLPDGSCCAPVQHTTSNTASLKLLPSVRMDPAIGPVGTKVVLFGSGFGPSKGNGDAVYFNGHLATIGQWTDTSIVVHVPLDAESGPLVLKQGEVRRTVGDFSVTVPKVTGISPAAAPIGTLVKISGENFGLYSESGSTPYAFTDFNKGESGVEIGGVPAVIYRWHNDRIDVWVPFSVKDGPVVVKRGGDRPNSDGTCCAEKKVLVFEAGNFTKVTPVVSSYSPRSGGLDEIVTIKGTGFGEFIKMRETVKIGMSERAYKRFEQELDENISRTEVLINGVAVQVISWTDTEIQVRVPRRHLWGIGKGIEFNPDLSKGTIVIRRGSWDVLPDGTCCQPKQYVSIPVGEFTIEARGIPDQSKFTDPRPDADTNQ